MNLHDDNPNLSDGTSNPPAEVETTMPIGVGNFEEQMAPDPLASTESRKRMDTGFLLIVVVILVAAAGLFAMRKLAHGVIQNDANAAVDKTIQEFLPRANSVLSSDAAALDVITEDYTDRQIPLTNVQRNPFILVMTDTEVPGEVLPDIDPKQQERFRREQMFNRAGEKLVVKSILDGTNPLANVNDKILRIGESIVVPPDNVEFEVTGITSDDVTLVAQDLEFDLRIEVQVVLKRN